MSVHLYVELLLKAKTIALYGSLIAPSPATPDASHGESNDTDSATLETNGPTLKVSHRGKTATLRLPVRNIGSAITTIHLPPASKLAEVCKDGGNGFASPDARAREITTRISLSGDDVASYLTLSASDESISGETVPWSAPQLSAETTTSCRDCGELVIPSGIREWRDLPREGWADLMDVWYCHKPVDHTHTSGEEQTQGKRGYGANNALEVSQGLGFVDSTSFLLHPTDTTVELANESLLSSNPVQRGPGFSDLLCTRCRAAVGMLDAETGGHRILKHRVCVQTIPAHPAISHPLEKWVTDRVITTAEGQAAKKFVVARPNSSNPSEPPARWMIWVLNADFYFCSASTDDESIQDAPDGLTESGKNDSSTPCDAEDEHDPVQALPYLATRACKVLYRPLSAEPDARQVEEELEMTSDFYPILWSCLERNHQLLPRSAQKMDDWTISVLRRFDLSDIDPDKFQTLMQQKRREQAEWVAELQKRKQERKRKEEKERAEAQKLSEAMKPLYE